MKALVFILTLGFAATANAQHITLSKVPLAVRLNAQKAHPNISKISWELEDKNYEAGFKEDGKETSEIYNSKGVLLEKEVAIAIADLPAKVKDYVSAHYKKHSIREASKITKNDGEVNYEAFVNGKDLIFDSKGGFIK
jgi:hypothetical protein